MSMFSLKFFEIFHMLPIACSISPGFSFFSLLLPKQTQISTHFPHTFYHHFCSWQLTLLYFQLWLLNWDPLLNLHDSLPEPQHFPVNSTSSNFLFLMGSTLGFTVPHAKGLSPTSLFHIYCCHTIVLVLTLEGLLKEPSNGLLHIQYLFSFNIACMITMNSFL